MPQDEREFLEDLARENRRLGKPIPKELEGLVEVRPEFADLWGAFLDLHGSRSSGMDSNPIPCSEVESWCRLHVVARWRWATFWRVVHVLDGVARTMARGARAK